MSDYLAQFGPTKYVSVDYSYSVGGMLNQFPGSFATVPGAKCEIDALSAARSVAREFYKFRDFGSVIPAEIQNYVDR